MVYAPRTQRLSKLKAFDDLVGEELVDLIFKHAPTKIGSRIGKALDHYTKALKLTDVDDEMGAIRCIAAEEELVVSIFEWMKLNENVLPMHSDFIGKFKNHKVKLGFFPVFSQFRVVLNDVLEKGFTMEGMEHVLLTATPLIIGDTVKIQIRVDGTETVINSNPLNVFVNTKIGSERDVVSEMYGDFAELIKREHGCTVKEFVTMRATFRDKLLYAEDGGYLEMEESLSELIKTEFSVTYKALLWCIAVLLTNKPSLKDTGIASQFIQLYRRVLQETKIL